MGPRALDLKLLLRGGPFPFFPLHGAIIKARRVSGRVPPDVSGAQGRRPLVPLQPPSGWIPSSFFISRFILLLSLSSLPIFVHSFPPLRHLLVVVRVLRPSLSLSSSRSRYLNCPSAEVFSRIANLWTSLLADRANDVLVCTYERAGARAGESYREWPRAGKT